MSREKPKTETGQITSTENAAAMCDLLGYYHRGPVALSKTEFENLRSYYQYVKSDDNALIQAGDMRNVFRDIEEDGLRVMAVLSHYLNDDEDPVIFIRGILEDVGFDTGKM